MSKANKDGKKKVTKFLKRNFKPFSKETDKRKSSAPSSSFASADSFTSASPIHSNNENDLTSADLSGLGSVDIAKKQQLRFLRQAGLWPQDKDPVDPSRDDIAKVTADSWNHFLSLQAISMSIQTCEPLKKLVRTIFPDYTKWTSEMEVNAWSQAAAVRRFFLIPFLEKGTARTVAKLFNKYVLHFTEAVNKEESFHSTDGLEFLTLMNILTRVNYNLEKLLDLGVISSAIRIIKIVLVKTRTPFNADLKNPSSPLELKELLMQLAIFNSFSILNNFISNFSMWRSANAIAGTSVERVTKEAKREILRLGILKIAHGYFEHLNSLVNTRETLSGSQRDFQFLLLDLVGAMLHQYPPSQNKLLETGLLSVMINWIRWPQHLLTDNTELKGSEISGVRSEYQLQLLCWQVIREAVLGNPQNAQRLSSLGGWEKLIDYIFWVCEIYSCNAAIAKAKASKQSKEIEKNSPHPLKHSWRSRNSHTISMHQSISKADMSYLVITQVKDKKVNPLSPPMLTLRSVTKELQHIFELLLEMSTGNVGVGLFSRNDKFKVAEMKLISYSTNTRISKLLRVVINVTLDLFNEDIRHSNNNTRVRDKLRMEYPELQLLVLQFLSNIIQYNSKAVEICRRFRLLDILFSNFFFFCGRDKDLSLTKEIQSKKSIESLHTSLQDTVFSFIEFIATIPGHDNIEEIGKLLDLLDTYHSNTNIVFKTCQTLVKILENNLVQTQQAFARLNALSVLVMIVNLQIKMAPAFTKNTNNIHSAEAQLFSKARFATLAVLNYTILNNPIISRVIIRDNRTIPALFTLVFEPDMRKFALNQIAHLLALPIQKQKNQPTDEYNDVIKFYNEYFKLFRKAQSGNLPSHFQLLIELLETIRVAVSLNPKSQKLFKQVGGFLNIVTLLNVEDKRERLPVLAIQVMKTLTALMANNDKNKAHFANDIGFDQLKKLFVRALENDTEKVLTNASLLLMFEMLVDGDFDIRTKYTIQNPDAIPLMFFLLNHLPHAKRVQFLDHFIKLVEKCPLNKSLCCSKHIINHLLEMIPPLHGDDILLGRLTTLIEILGTHSITVKELKRLFLLLRSEPGDFRPIAQTTLMKALQFMALSSYTGPSVFFDFDGKTSGLILPPLEKLWPQGGFSFFCWVRIESFQDPTGQPKFEPRLFSIFDDEGNGIDLFFTSYKTKKETVQILELQTVSFPSKKKLSCKFDEFPFEEKKWYHIVLTHNNQSRVLWHQSEVKLYINGEAVQKQQMKYPQLPPVLSQCRIGTNLRVATRRGSSAVPAHAQQQFRISPFYGQMGPITFLNDVLTVNQVKLLAQRITESYDVLGTDQNEAIIQAEIKSNMLQEISQHIFLQYNCKARSRKYFLDITPERNRDKRLDAKLVGRLNSCVKRDVKDIIHCLGGIKVLFPLFAQLNQPLVPKTVKQRAKTVTTEVPLDFKIDYSIDTQLVLQVLALLGDMLNKSRTNQQEMLRCHGCKLVSFIIRKASPEHRTARMLVTLDAMGNKIMDPILLQQFYNELLFDWELWIHASYNVQYDMLELFKQKMQAFPKFFCAALVDRASKDFNNASTNYTSTYAVTSEDIEAIQKLLDVLYFIYYYQPNQFSFGKEPIYHPITKECIGKRPQHKELNLLRNSIYNILLYQIERIGLSPPVLRRIIVSILDNHDPIQTFELLVFLSNLMKKYPSVIDLLELELFILLLYNGNEKVRAITLQIIAMLLRTNIKSNKKLKNKPSDVWAVAFSKLHTFPFGKITYHVLFSILSGQHDYNGYLDQDASFISIDENIIMVVPEVLPLIFKLLLVGSGVIRQTVLQDMYLLLSNSYENREVMLRMFGWQDWLFALLADGGSEQQESAKVYNEIVINIFKVLLLHSFKVDKNGFKRLLDITLAFLSHYVARGVLEREVVTRALFNKILTAIQAQANLLLKPKTEADNNSDAIVEESTPTKDVNSSSSWKDMDVKSSPPLIMNIIYLIAAIEEFIYYNPSEDEVSAILERRTNSSSAANDISSSCVTIMTRHFSKGEWADFDLARKTLDTLDLLKLLTENTQPIMEQLAKGQMRAGGLQRIVLRFALDVIRDGDINVCVETVPRIRAVIDRDISNKNEVSKILTYLLSSLLRTLKYSVNDKVVSFKAKSIVPLMKDLLRACMSVLPPAAKEEVTSSKLQYITESGTAREFIDSFKTPQWAAMLSWADSMATTFENDERNFCEIIEKQRNKHMQYIEENTSRANKAEIFEERRLEDEFSTLKSQYVYPEKERKLEVVQKMYETRKTTARQWRRILRSLTNERGPWGNKESIVYWKLDKTENLSRMRLKLKRNYRFDPHVGAARIYVDQNQSEEENDEEDEQNNDSKSESDVKVEDDLKIFSGVKLAATTEEFTEDLVAIEDGKESKSTTSSVNDEELHPNQKEEKLVYSTQAELVTPMNVTPGIIEITTTHIYFKETRHDGEEQGKDRSPISLNTVERNRDDTKPIKEVKIALDQLKEVHLRRYLLRRSALEMFLVNRNNYFFNFRKRERNKVYNKIMTLQPANLTYFETGSPEQILKRLGLTRKWQNRQISNFDYLMQLNTIAGRTYNDLTQYPVFPWILSNYDSETIDLDDPSVYRDLSKPIGALNPTRLEMFITRFENFSDPDIPKFHYGSHYSSAAIVLFYLIRVEPFTTYFLKLQGGKFDFADRMFDSIPQTWSNCYNASSDVKELIPEFFYFPDFLVNANKFDLGKKQGTNQNMGDIALPKWAKTPEDFVRINRAALESEYVSQHLHEWIDLIFGFKQRGERAVAAHNVFYYLTYEGAVDIDAIESEAQRRATESQIDNFGQTPAQLLRRAHPIRLSLENSQAVTLFKCIEQANKLPTQRQRSAVKKNIETCSFKLYPINLSKDALVYVCVPSNYFLKEAGGVGERVITVDRGRQAAVHRFSASQLTSNPPIPFSFDLDPSLPSRGGVGVPFAADQTVTAHCFAATPDAKMIISCGHWDNTIKCSLMDNAKLIQSIDKHKDLVTCLAITSDGKTLVTGSKDTTLLVWEIVYVKNTPNHLNETPISILHGHSDDVTCVAVDYGMDLCVSGSKDGTCIVHNLSFGTYVRSIEHPSGCGIDLIATSCFGHIILYSNEDLVLNLLDVNGKFLCAADTHDRVNYIFTNKTAEWLVTGNRDGTIVIRRLFDLQVINKIQTSVTVLSLTMSDDDMYILAGLADGDLMIITVENK